MVRLADLGDLEVSIGSRCWSYVSNGVEELFHGNRASVRYFSNQGQPPSTESQVRTSGIEVETYQ